MKWTIRIELTPDGNAPITREIGTITRSMADLCPEEVGLTLEEGRQLLQSIQHEIIGAQVHAYELCRRRCVECGRRQQVKDVRTKCVQTIFGAYRFRGRRLRSCGCRLRPDEPRQDFPLGEIIPRRTTPEVRFLFAELGATMPYRAASRVLGSCGFAQMRASHRAIRRHTLELGKAIDAQRISAPDIATDPSSHADAAASLTIGIDDTYVRHHKHLASLQIQVTAGRLERNGQLGARFAFVASSGTWEPAQFRGFLAQQGQAPNTAMRIVTDGDDGLRNFVQHNIPTPAETQLDWFHIGMRLENLRKAVSMPMTYDEYRRSLRFADPRDARVSRLRDALWRGRSWRALLQFARLRRDIDRWEAENPNHRASDADRTRKTIDKFQKYVCGNRRSLPDFALQRAAGHRISTAHVESVMNHLVNHRLSKKQQMRWSPAGAHYLLQVRAELLNGSLSESYRVVHARFRPPSTFVRACR